MYLNDGVIAYDDRKEIEMQKIARATPFEAASLSRVWQHTQNRNVGILTAHRAGNDVATNNRHNAELAAAIRASGLGYLKVKGRYVENYGTPDAKNVDENSYLVVGKEGDDNGQLKGFLKQQGQKFDQDSVLYKPYDDESAYLIGTNNADFPGYGNEHPVGKWHPNKMAEFHSVLFPGKSFTFEAAMANPRKYEKIGFYKQRSFSARGEESEF